MYGTITLWGPTSQSVPLTFTRISHCKSDVIALRPRAPLFDFKEADFVLLA